MRDNLLATSTASTGADAKSLSVDYQVLEVYARIKATLCKQPSKEPSEDRTRPCDALKCAFVALKSALGHKCQLLTKGAKLGADWDWQVTCTSTDTQELVDLVQGAATHLVVNSNTDDLHDFAKFAVKAAADLAVHDLCQVASIIKHSWNKLPCDQKQADHMPLDLVSSLGLLLSRLYACAANVSSSGATHVHQQAMALLQQLCSKPCQLLMQESIAGYLFLFRWHEQQQQGARAPAYNEEPTLDAMLAAAFDKYQPALLKTSTTPSDSNITQEDLTSSPVSPALQSAQSLPRFVSSTEVLHAHSSWTSSFQLPVIPTAKHWKEAQEVLVGWSNMCCRARELGLPLEVNEDCFLLAVEALWLFAQPSEQYGVTSAATITAGSVTAGAKASAATTTVEAAAATTATGHINELNLLGLWSTFLPTLLTCIEPAAAAAVATAADTHSSSSSSGEAAAAAPQRMITTAGSVLLGLLAETLMHLTLLWQQQPAASRSALMRSVISESDLSDLARQKRVHKLLGKAKPKPNEVVVGHVLLLVRQLAAVLVDLLQLERKMFDDNSTSTTTSGEEGCCCSCLWLKSPGAMCRILELMLRCPIPICPATTTLIELLMDDLWEAIKILPLLDDVMVDQGLAVREVGAPTGVLAAAETEVAGTADNGNKCATTSAVVAAVASCQKAVRSWQAAVSDVLPLLPRDGKAAAAAAGSVRSSDKPVRKTPAKKIPSAGQARARLHDAAAAAAGSSTVAAAAPAWLLAAADADPCAAVGVMLTLLSRGLECAQKAYYWRWYLWWKQQQQSRQARLMTTTAAAAVITHSAGQYGGSSWSSSGSFLSSASSHIDDLDFINDDQDDQDDLEIDAAAAAVIESSSPASSYSSTSHIAAAAALSSRSAAASSSASPRAVECPLWGDNAFKLALGFTALAGPAFAFVDSVAKTGHLHALEVQTVLSLLESVSDGLHSNSLILAELHRSLLLPQHLALAAAATSLSNVLDSMLARAVTADANNSSSTNAAAAAAVIIAPEPSASLDTYDAFWLKLKFSPIDQLTLSQAAASLVSNSELGTAPAKLLNPVGCQNPSCHIMSGFSECDVKTLACRACRQVAYCSKECQRQHWRSHKAACQTWQQQQDAEWVEVFSEDFGESLDD